MGTGFRYNELFFMIDTCQANTMYSKFYSPNVLATGSSVLGENSYSVSSARVALLAMSLNALLQYENDYDIGVAVIDSYTHHILEYMEGIDKTSQTSMQDLVSPAREGFVHSADPRGHSLTRTALRGYTLTPASARISSPDP